MKIVVLSPRWRIGEGGLSSSLPPISLFLPCLSLLLDYIWCKVYDCWNIKVVMIKMEGLF